ncbi:hypothetical protein CspeluHIS016_0500170 [Cutaneotrichosporon spelunceum]|uniref:Uncharacterized protein n=1 Tax=Cutaneotrichosporon spelunceum TaxID=1672016 RepID=A0AAD3TWV8_9TREE|nr:hypothetical protein CspeluHIS016_0500170 [Cutaneotrichosporon spelunceum]
MVAWTALSILLACVVPASAPDTTKLRRLMVESRFISNISPCPVGLTNPINAVEWVRTEFYDATGYNSTPGTGGIDGSIQYELDYDNAGVTFPSTIALFKYF